MKKAFTFFAIAQVMLWNIIAFGQSGTISVSTPNGGQSWAAGSSQYIYWSSSNVTNAKLEYTTDNGTSWFTIISSTPASTGYYNWSVPNTPSTICKVKISDAGSPSVFDVSDNVFSIVTPSITVTTPNGGETWTALNYQYVYWIGTGTSYYTVEYSTDNGSTWTNLITGTSGTSYYWYVPNTLSTMCKVRVKDYYNSNTYDISDNAFTISAPVSSVTVTTPNGGQTWAAGSSQYIYWNSSNITDVKIEYSTNNGTSWSPVIASTTASTGYYQWTVPGVTSNLCKIKISDVFNPSINDISDNVFIINIPSITVNTPNGGEIWTGNTYNYIYWSSSGLSSYVVLEYSTDNGSVWNMICNGCSNSGSYNWNVPNDPSATCLVRVSDYYSPSISDASNGVFTINPAIPTITVSTPNGGENLVAGSNYYIEYSASNSTNVKIEYSTDNGTTWNTIIASTTASYQYYWNPIPSTLSTQCLIKISDVAQPSYYDVSNSAFTITDPYITVTEPNGGESYVAGTSKYMYWNYAGTSSYVTVEYSTDGGSTYNTIVAGAGNYGYYYWNPIPGTPSNTCKVRISDYYSPSIIDASDNNFAITASGSPTIQITTPNGGDQWNAGSSQYIYWNSSNASTVHLYYSTDDGFSWNSIATGVTASNGYYYWNPIPSVNSNQCRVKVVDTTGYYDISNNTFSILTPSVTVVTPNGGESWTSGTSQTLSWYASGLSYVKVYYSLDNGSTWTYWSYLSTTNGLNSYSWPVPTVTSMQDLCLVRLEDYYNSATYDVGDAVFTINPAPPTLMVTTPNGGEIWATNSSQYIYWSSSNIANVMIEYTTDNGSTWNTITASTAASSGYYYWSPLPSTPSANCKIRVSDASNPSTYDLSNNVFSIVNPSVLITSPNGGESWQALSYHYIYYQAYGLSSYIKVDYSVNGGASWTNICNGCSNSGSYYWYVANTPSSICKVRVADYYDTTIYDISDLNFTITAPTPTITVSTPNGGDQWAAGSSQYIYWSSQYVTNVKLEYSLNNGNTWSTIISSTPASSGYYYWPVPNTPSILCKIKISDASNPSLNDVSNNVFSIITPSITVTTPNGGEQWQGASNYYIYWTSSGISSYVNIDYSLDAGITWSAIVNGTWNGGSYYWYVPNTGSNNCKIRITDYYTNTIYDESDNLFTIVSTTPTITVTAPNGGEIWGVGNSYYISWSSFLVTNVKIEYSTDYGGTWSAIIASTPAGNSYYYWTIPNTPSMECLVRVSDASNASINDQSNSSFTIIVPVITVTYPDGGESFTASSAYTITWTSSGISSYVNIYYSTDNGATWSWVVNGTYNSGSYNWYVPNAPSAQCKIKIADYYNSNQYDLSNNTFTILPAPPSVTVTSPNGGEVWPVMTQKYIYWSSTNINYVRLEYSVNGGSGWNTIISSTAASNGYYLWPVPNMPSTNCLVRISDASNPAVYDISNDPFSIVVPFITVTTPNGGESWTGLSYYYLYWTSSGISNYVTIEYSTNNGSSWSTVANYVYNSGYYNWLVPNTPSTNCLVRIKDYNSPTVSDVSNAAFTITAAPSSIIVYAPNGAESYGVGSNQYITWTSSNVTNVKIEYSTDNGSTWNTVIASTSASTGYYYWPVPNNPSTFCLVKISDASNSSIYDVSNNVFSIVNPNITVTTPNGGQIWTGNTYQYIYWTSSGISSYVKVEYSTDNGATYTVVTSATYNNGYYYWYVPNTPSVQCLVKISDYYTGSIYDVSNSTFTILSAPSTITVTTPNGYEQWAVGTNHYIYWSSSSVTDVKLEYTTNGGSTWNTIIVSTPASPGYYNWPVPNAPSTSCFVRISDATNSSVSDVSDNPFTITAPYITVSYPNGGETLLIGSYYYVWWSSLGVNKVNIDYSTDGGTTWNVIVANTYNYNYYYWTVPNTPSANCKIRVTDATTSTVTDMSNSVFTIATPTPTITVYSPYGGEVWYVGYQNYITWTSSGVTFVKLEFSKDNGTTWSTIISSTSASSGFYYWPVPNQPSTTCLIRISDAGNASVNDVSGMFTIATPVPSVAVIDPNGGETWYSGSYQYIEWSKNFVNAVNIYYSTDSGTTWNNLANNLTGWYYYWYIPSLTSNDCYVKVESSSNASLYDLSDAVFTIDLPPVNSNAITTDSVAPFVFCKQDTIIVDFTATGTYNVGNVFTAQLSDSSGNFTYGTPIGSIGGTTSGAISCVVPYWALNGSGYRVRVTASDWPAIGSDNGNDIMITGPQFDFAASETIKYLPDGQVDFSYLGDTTNMVSFDWIFGDGGTSTLVNPTYFYTAIGFYDVSLTVVDVNGCSVVVDKPSYMRIEQLYPNEQLNTGTSLDITSVSFSNTDVGCVGLADGNCAVTFDGGLTFTTLTTGLTSSSTGVVVLPGGWYIFGYGGQAYVSTNQGATWSPMYTGTTENFLGCNFTTATTGYAVGTNGAAYYYNGTNWVQQVLNWYYDLFNVYSWGNYAWAVGAYGGIVYYDGSAWTTQTTGITSDVNSVYMVDSTLGFAVANDGYILSFNGISWSVSLSGVDVHFSDVTAHGDSVWAVANSGIMYRSADGGATWERYSIGSTNDISAVTFKVAPGKVASATRGYITGKGGDARVFDPNEGDTTVAVKQLVQAKSQFKIYPNPAVSYINIETTVNDAAKLNIVMKDMHGKVVETICNKTVKGKYAKKVNVSGLADGIYFMHITQNGQSWVQKVAVQK